MRALCFDYLNEVDLFAVGDPEQAIFGWTGSRPELLTELAALPGVHPVHLEQDVELTELLLGYQNQGQSLAHRLLTDLLDSGLRKGLTRPSQSDEAAELAKMERALTTGPLKDLTMSGLAERARKVDRVKVTTMTSSKGLEFDDARFTCP